MADGRQILFRVLAGQLCIADVVFAVAGVAKPMPAASSSVLSSAARGPRRRGAPSSGCLYAVDCHQSGRYPSAAVPCFCNICVDFLIQCLIHDLIVPFRQLFAAGFKTLFYFLAWRQNAIVNCCSLPERSLFLSPPRTGKLLQRTQQVPLARPMMMPRQQHAAHAGLDHVLELHIQDRPPASQSHAPVPGSGCPRTAAAPAQGRGPPCFQCAAALAL